MVHLNSDRIAAFVLCTILLCAGCGEDAFSPEEAVLADYMPLQMGYSAKYGIKLYYNSYSSTYGSSVTREIEGTCEIKILKSVTQGEYTYLRLSAEYDVVDQGKNGINLTCVYDLIQSLERLWYVADTLGYPHLNDNQERQPIMNLSAGKGILTDLTPFIYPGWVLAPWSRSTPSPADNYTSSSDENLNYHVNVNAGSSMIQEGKIILQRYTGIISIDYSTTQGIPGSLSGATTTRISYKRI
jgi:hypothetical protein